MTKESPKPNRRSSRLAIWGVVFLLLVLGYFGAYYANIAVRIDMPVGSAVWPPHVPDKCNLYRIGQEQSEVIFWPAERVDALLRP